MFDLNELESLAPIDIEFMIYSCLSATYKLYSINNEIDTDIINNFVLKDLVIPPDSRVTVSTLLSFFNFNLN